MSSGAFYEVSKEVRYTRTFEEGVVLRQKAGEVIVVNDVGFSVLSLVGSGVGDPEEIADRILHDYDIDRATALRDVAAYLDELEAAGIIAQAEK